MRCYTVDGSGLESLRLEERPSPGKPGPGDALVDVHAVSLNYRDLMVADGRYGGKMDPPIIACADMAGTVVAVGEKVTELQPGDRVLNAPFRFWPAGAIRSEWARTFVGGHGVDGVLAEQLYYPAVSLVRVPTHLSFAEGSTLTIAGLTAWAAVVTHGRVRPGEWVLLHGTGGVSIYGAQIAKLFGARTILSTSNPEKGRIAQERFGVDALVDYRDPNWPKEARKLTGGAGVDVIVEVGGGSTLSSSVQACANGARIGLIGVLGGAQAEIDVRQMLARQIAIRGIFMESTQELRDLARAMESSCLRPCVDRVFPFDEAPSAYAYLNAQKHMGKVVIQVRPE